MLDLGIKAFQTCQALPPLKQLSLWLVMVPPPSQDLTLFTRQGKSYSWESSRYILQFWYLDIAAVLIEKMGRMLLQVMGTSILY